MDFLIHWAVGGCEHGHLVIYCFFAVFCFGILKNINPLNQKIAIMLKHDQ